MLRKNPSLQELSCVSTSLKPGRSARVDLAWKCLEASERPQGVHEGCDVYSI